MDVLAQRDILGDAKGCIEFFVAVVLISVAIFGFFLIRTVIKFMFQPSSLLVLCPTCVCLLARNSLVNKVKFLVLIPKKVVRTNEIVRSVIIMQHFPYNRKLFISTRVSIPFLSGFSIKCFEHC